MEAMPVAHQIIGSWSTQCSHCMGNASPHETHHVSGGPATAYDEGSSLSDKNGCGARFITTVEAEALWDQASKLAKVEVFNAQHWYAVLCDVYVAVRNDVERLQGTDTEDNDE